MKSSNNQIDSLIGKIIYCSFDDLNNPGVSATGQQINRIIFIVFLSKSEAIRLCEPVIRDPALNNKVLMNALLLDEISTIFLPIKKPALICLKLRLL